MNLKEILNQMRRGAVKLTIKGEPERRVGASRFGGAPDVPADFSWPEFETDTFDDEEVKLRPLAFLAQLDCAEMAAHDKEGLLPKTGVLSFFYELGSQRWGFDPKDEGAARVFWFESAVLSPAQWPLELEEDYRLPAMKITASTEASVPDWADLLCAGRADLCEEADWDQYEAARKELGIPVPDCAHRLLGWPDIIQSGMTMECEMVSRGYYMGDDSIDIPEEEWQAMEAGSVDEWRLLFQLDMVEKDDFELMFGDCGRIYYYIKKEDLAARRFDRCRLILQCC